jgi:hypothetical protein
MGNAVDDCVQVVGHFRVEVGERNNRCEVAGCCRLHGLRHEISGKIGISAISERDARFLIRSEKDISARRRHTSDDRTMFQRLTHGQAHRHSLGETNEEKASPAMCHTHFELELKTSIAFITNKRQAQNFCTRGTRLTGGGRSRRCALDIPKGFANDRNLGFTFTREKQSLPNKLLCEFAHFAMKSIRPRKTQRR